MAGNVYEPYLDACIRPNILFPAYTAGYNLAESFYMAMKYLSWQSIIVGDPLCSPFGDSSIYLNYILSLNNLAYLLADTDSKLDEAKLIAEKAFQLEPSHNVIDIYGWICYKKKEYFRAIELFNRALQISSKNPVILFHASLTWLRLDNQENARLMMEKALSISKYFPGADRAQKLLSNLR